MTLTAAALPRSSAAAPRLDVVARTGSTNADLVSSAATDPDAWPHLAAIVTDDQSAGRGRLGRSWTTPPGSALAISVLLRTQGLPPAARGWIPLIAGAAMAQAVGAQLTDRVVQVKWPNDVLVDGRKLCGVLTELTPQGVVIGAGLNTAMTREQMPVATATSLRLEGAALDGETPSELLDRALSAYLDELVVLIDEWRAASGPAALRARVEPLLQTSGRAVRVDRPGLPPLLGTAEGLADDGSLRVHPAHGDALTVSAGDVTHLRYE